MAISHPPYPTYLQSSNFRQIFNCTSLAFPEISLAKKALLSSHLAIRPISPIWHRPQLCWRITVQTLQEMWTTKRSQTTKISKQCGHCCSPLKDWKDMLSKTLSTFCRAQALQTVLPESAVGLSCYVRCWFGPMRVLPGYPGSRLCSNCIHVCDINSNY